MKVDLNPIRLDQDGLVTIVFAGDAAHGIFNGKWLGRLVSTDRLQSQHQYTYDIAA